MKYQTKIYLAFSGLVLGTSLLVEGLTYIQTRKFLMEELRNKVSGVAITTSKLLNPDLVEAVLKDSNDQSGEYKSLIGYLRSVRDANRNDSLKIVYIYLIRPNPNNRNQMIIVADASEDREVYVAPGTIYDEEASIGILDHVDQPFAPHKIVEDRWGRFLPGYAPIYNKEGKYLATIGVNLSHEYVEEHLHELRWIALFSIGISLVTGLLVATLIANGITRSLDQICDGVVHIGRGEWETRIQIHSTDEFADLATAINSMAKGLQEREKLKLNFVRYVSKHIMEKILKADRAPVLHGERRKISVLFSDIRDFTSLAERLDPETLVSLLNEYLGKMLDVIFEQNGTLDKFIGDGLMVEFGAPIDDSAQEIHAIQTAIEMQKAVIALNKKWLAEGRPQISIGIGIHTGPAVVGNIGSEKRMEYTAIGDTVNVAARIESATKQLNVQILVSEQTWEGTKNRFKGKNLGPLQLKGRDDPITVYSILDT